jgi:hypothetical protein
MVSWLLEITVGVVIGILVTLAVGVHVGRGVAFLVCGAGWAFPDLANLFTSVPGVVAGDPAAGLDHAPSPEPADWALWTSRASSRCRTRVRVERILPSAAICCQTQFARHFLNSRLAKRPQIDRGVTGRAWRRRGGRSVFVVNRPASNVMYIVDTNSPSSTGQTVEDCDVKMMRPFGGLPGRPADGKTARVARAWSESLTC